MPYVLVPGGVLVDVSVAVPVLPPRGGDVLASGSGLFVAGAYNVGAAAARQGAATAMGAAVGSGPFGLLARSALAADGIALTGRSSPALDTGTCIALVEPDGERTMVTVSGAEAILGDGDLADLVAVPGDVVAFSGYDLDYPGAWAEQLRWLEALPAGVLVVFDPSPLVDAVDPDRLARALARTDVLTLNRREGRLVTGSDASGPALLDRVRRTVRDGSGIVLRDGGRTVLAVGGAFGSVPVAIEPLPTDAVDTTGAGDTHTGVLCAELALGTPARTALMRATAAASLSVARRGSATGPTRAELDAALAR